MAVPLLDLKAQFLPIEAGIRSALDRVLSSQQFVLGEEVAALEKEISAYLGGVEAVGVASGTDALLLALMALEIGEGDEVITTPYTFFATASADLTTDGRRELEAFFTTSDAFSYTVAGHTDSRGSEAYNQTLSEARASAVASVARSVGAVNVALSRETPAPREHYISAKGAAPCA